MGIYGTNMIGLEFSQITTKLDIERRNKFDNIK